MRRIFFIFAALAAVVSCTKEEQQKRTIPITIKAEMGEFQNETKADIVKSVRIVWKGSEKVYVYDGSNYLGYIETPSTISDNRVAELSGTITEPANANTTLTFVYSNLFTNQPVVIDNQITVDMRSQTSDLPFVVYGTAEYTSDGINKSTVSFKFATSAVMVGVTNLEPDVKISKEILLDVNTQCVLTLGAAGNVTVSGTTPGPITKTEAANVANASGYAFLEFGVPVCEANSDRCVSAFQNSVHFGKTLADAIETSKYVNSIAELKPAVFSVSNGTKVAFSRGNLQATYSASTSSYTWGFAENQYEVVSGNPSNRPSSFVPAKYTGNNTIDSQTDSAKVDLFGWVGASSSFTGNKAYGISSSTTDSDYGNVKGESIKSDWGTTIDNKGTWRTLSYSEWAYLFDTNATRNGLYRRSWIQITSLITKSGLFIYPDGWPADQIPSSNYTLAEWLDAEAKGVVFLPDSGDRDGSNVYSDDVYGATSAYWSSTSYSGQNAYALKTSATQPLTFETKSRHRGLAVRLVTAVK